MTSLQCVFHEVPLRFRPRTCHPDLRRELPCGEKDFNGTQLHPLPQGACGNHAKHACMRAGRESYYGVLPGVCTPSGGCCAELYLPSSSGSLVHDRLSSAQQIPIAVAAYFLLLPAWQW